MGVVDTMGAFVPHGRIVIDGRPGGPLDGLTFAAKDLYDIAGHATGCGSPERLAAAAPATATAPQVQALLDAGAKLVGKTITDEMAYSMIGENAHYGTPTNPRAPGRVPGGSSSGSASAVAGSLVDLALGSDTGGSVRTPASFCGLFGIRPTHGRIPLDGVMPLAPSFDTVGWFTRDADLLGRVGSVLLGAGDEARRPRGVLIVEDGFAIADPQVRTALGPLVDAVTAALAPPRTVSLSGNGLADWAAAFRILQGREAWQSHGAWITAAKPRLGPGVAERFAWSATITDEEVADANALRARVTADLWHLLADGDVLCLPTVPSIAPLRNSPPELLETFRRRAHGLLCIAGLGGLPQVTLPLGEVDGCPVGLSLIARSGGDEMLLAAARRVMALV